MVTAEKAGREITHAAEPDALKDLPGWRADWRSCNGDRGPRTEIPVVSDKADRLLVISKLSCDPSVYYDPESQRNCKEQKCRSG